MHVAVWFLLGALSACHHSHHPAEVAHKIPVAKDDPPECFQTPVSVFWDVLDTSVEEFWIYDGPGTPPWTPGSMGDDIAMAAYGLYRIGEVCDRPDYIDKADKTVEYEVWMLDEILMGHPVDVKKAIMGSPALIHGIDHYNGSPFMRWKIRSYASAGCLAGSLLALTLHEELGSDFGSPVSLLAAAADMDLELYERNGQDIYLRFAQVLLEVAHNNYWVTTPYGSYYRSVDPMLIPEDLPWDFELANILSPLAKAYHHTCDLRYLVRIRALLDVMDTHLWDAGAGGYWSTPLHSAKILSHNLFNADHHIVLFGLTGDAVHLDRTYGIMEFAESVLYDGAGHLMHHIVDGEVSGWFCTGCQFFFLNQVYDLDQSERIHRLCR